MARLLIENFLRKSLGIKNRFQFPFRKFCNNFIVKSIREITLCHIGHKTSRNFLRGQSKLQSIV